MTDCKTICRHCLGGHCHIVGTRAFALVMADAGLTGIHANANFAPVYPSKKLVRRKPLEASKALRKRFEESHQILA